MSWFYDYSKKEGEHTLGGMVTDSLETREWYSLTENRRRERIIEQLKRIFATKLNDVTTIEEVEKYEEFLWPQEDFSDGCVLTLPPNSRKELGVLNTSVDEMVFFAGTALAQTYKGYVDGALASGERAANRVLSGNLHESTTEGVLEPDPKSTSSYTPWLLRMLFAESAETLSRRNNVSRL